MTDTAPRRVVLLEPDGSPGRVLLPPPGRFLHLALPQLARENPGRLVRGEWWDRRRGRWIPFCHVISAAPLPEWLQRPDKKRRARR